MEFVDQENETSMLISSLLTSDFSLISTNDHHQIQQDPDDGEKKGEAKKRRIRRRRRKKSKRDGDQEEESPKKRRLSEEQVKFLEMSFGNEKKLESGRKVLLATQTGLDPLQVAVWFQNRRARWKNKKLEEEYVKLKSEHQAAIVQKCHLEAEVLSLNQKLAEAETRIRKMTGAGSNSDGVSGVETISSPTTSFSVECQPFLGEEDIVFMNEHNYVNMLDWVDLCGM